ncbi:BrnT family toxin [Dyadobacter luticola]|uniref:BrnT family toxin n=1 Tax=Dyadobacter luticola TaxID=1979387 RepID=A0A5R9KVE1_9BACT|nr:BrnT family toxin [Dyadobacter luticola]TLV00027.1 BrnT family toxin [Dyadobacter luticola]
MALLFEWDDGNIIKSVEKHGITNRESESIFHDVGRVIRLSKRGSGTEVRYLCYGLSESGRILTAYFIVRNGKIRIIGTRVARKEEREYYKQRQIQ